MMLTFPDICCSLFEPAELNCDFIVLLKLSCGFTTFKKVRQQMNVVVEGLSLAPIVPA